MIEIVNPNDARAARNKDNVLALYEAMINRKKSEGDGCPICPILVRFAIQHVVRAASFRPSEGVSW